MNKKINVLLFALVSWIMISCVTPKEVRYLQQDENLIINEQGLIPYNIPEYRITQNDMLKLNIITTPKGDAAQFYSRYNTSGGLDGGNSTGVSNTGSNRGVTGSSSVAGGNIDFFFNGIRVNRQGEIRVFGIGLIKVEGRTLDDVAQEIQDKVNEKFLKGKSEVRLNTDGITYYILGDVETITVTGEKVAHLNTLTLTQALSINGGLDRSVDKTNIKIIRKLPEGMQIGKIDLTREDAMNSPYYWVQNGDEIYLNTRKKNLNGFGKNPVQTLTTGVSLLTTAMSIYLLLSRF